MRTRQSQPPDVASGRMTTRHRATIWLLCLAATAIVLACDLGLPGQTLGGQTTRASYNCANAATNGCFADLRLTALRLNRNLPPLPSTFVGAESDILVVPLSCNATCQSSSGKQMPPGFIATYLTLTDDTNGEYISVGYETTPLLGNQFFMTYYLPDIFNNPQPTALFGPTGINPGYTGSAPYATFEIVWDPPSFWQVAIFPPNGAKPYGFTTGRTFFTPTSIRYVQQLWGHSGASAPLAVFTNNRYFVNIFSTAYVNKDGIAYGIVGSPNGQWINRPSQSNNGGAYGVQCC